MQTSIAGYMIFNSIRTLVVFEDIRKSDMIDSLIKTNFLLGELYQHSVNSPEFFGDA